MPLRRRSPLWVRALGSRELHGIAFKLERDAHHCDLSDRQEWLWDACVSELEWRHRNTARILERCSCRLCIPPFPD